MASGIGIKNVWAIMNKVIEIDFTVSEILIGQHLATDKKDKDVISQVP